MTTTSSTPPSPSPAASSDESGRQPLNRAQRVIVGVVIGGAVVIAGIGFAGSYAAVRDLAIRKGFGAFAHVFPLGVDAGILVLLALDLLLTWLRMPFPMLRQSAWLLTAATIAFNGAAAWPDLLGVGMHGVIPVLFVVTVEAARHAIGQLANITAGRHMEPVRLIRWLLSPVPTFKLWRRMKLWELRSYERGLELERERLVYQARLRIRFGRAWRRTAPVEDRLPLKLARYGVPLSSDRVRSSAPPRAPEGTALEAHVADALAIASTADGTPGFPASEGRSVPPQPVKADADAGMNIREGVSVPRSATVDTASEREPGIVNPGAGSGVNPPVHAPADAPVNGSRGAGSRASVNVPARAPGSRMKPFTVPAGAVLGRVGQAPGSRMKPFTPTVHGDVVNRVNSVNPLFKGTVNGFTQNVKPGEFTREGTSVNRPVRLPADRESDKDVNGAPRTVNPASGKAVNEHRHDREGESVNDSAVNSRRTRRAHAAKTPASVHAAVDARPPSPEEAERLKAAAEWFAAKKADPSLKQKDFVAGLGRSQSWMTKVLKEAAQKAEAAADG